MNLFFGALAYTFIVFFLFVSLSSVFCGMTVFAFFVLWLTLLMSKSCRDMGEVGYLGGGKLSWDMGEVGYLGEGRSSCDMSSVSQHKKKNTLIYTY